MTDSLILVHGEVKVVWSNIKPELIEIYGLKSKCANVILKY